MPACVKASSSSQRTTSKSSCRCVGPQLHKNAGCYALQCSRGGACPAVHHQRWPSGSVFVSGAGAAAAKSASCRDPSFSIFTPTPAQVQRGAIGSKRLLYRGPVDCATQIFRAHGARGLFQGGTTTVFRETPAFGLYFASYEWTKVQMERQWGFGAHASSFWAGGLAGALSWMSIYPFDVVKSVQQV